MREAATAGRDEFVTKTDLDAIRANLAPCATRTDLAALEARMYRVLWIQGGANVAILTALRFLPT